MFNKPNLFHKTTETPASRGNVRSTAGTTISAATTGAATTSTVKTMAETQAASAAASSAAATADVSSVGSADGGAEHGDGKGGESRLIVGPDVKLKGAEILDCDTLVVEGRVEATMDSRVLRIAEKGAYKGTVGIDIAEIHGHFEGELTAREQLLIHATGRVSGKIRYGKILIEEGGELSGDVQSLGSAGKEGLRAVETKSAESRPLAAVAG